MMASCSASRMMMQFCFWVLTEMVSLLGTVSQHFMLLG